MNKGILGISNDLGSQRFYHGTRADLKPGDLIEPGNLPDAGERDRMATYVYLTPKLDEAIWEAELAVGEVPGRVYIVEPIGQIGDASDLTDRKSPGHPSMSCCSGPHIISGKIGDSGGCSCRLFLRACLTIDSSLSPCGARINSGVIPHMQGTVKPRRNGTNFVVR